MRARQLLLLVLAFLAPGLIPAGGAYSASGDSAASPGVVLSGDARFDLEAMTYVSSRAGEPEVVLAAERAEFQPERDVVLLDGVHLRVSEREGVVGFELRCERGELLLGAGDFLAQGDVRGRTRDGRVLRTEQLRYRHAQALVRTDSPVEIHDAAGTYRGGGFEYYVRDARFRLLGGASVVQGP